MAKAGAAIPGKEARFACNLLLYQFTETTLARIRLKIHSKFFSARNGPWASRMRALRLGPRLTTLVRGFYDKYSIEIPFRRSLESVQRSTLAANSRTTQRSNALRRDPYRGTLCSGREAKWESQSLSILS